MGPSGEPKAAQAVGMSTDALRSSERNDWGTPAVYIEAAREVMGGIDLDPASSAKHNKIVRAGAYFTEKDDGLCLSWMGSVWINPPYGKRNGKSNQGRWLRKLITEYEKEFYMEVYQAIMLINSCTADKWFQPAWKYPLLFTDHRIKFIDPTTGKRSAPTHGNVFVYFGENPNKFRGVFSRFGRYVPPVTVCHG